MVKFLKDNSRFITLGIIVLLVVTVIYFINNPIRFNSKTNNAKVKLIKEEKIEYSEPIINYYCSDGSEPENNKCRIVVDTTITIKSSYSCSKGELVGNSCRITEQIIPEEKYGSDFRMNCLMSYGLYDDAGNCFVTNFVDATPHYSCFSGYTLVGNQCIKYEYVNALYNLSCPNGFDLDGTLCIKKIK